MKFKPRSEPKRRFALSILFLCSAALAQEKYRPGQYPVNQNPKDYTIKVHISAIHFREPCTPDGVCSTVLYADALLNGKKVELGGNIDKRRLLTVTPGDYWAMLPKKKPGPGSLFQGYYLLLPDKSAWLCEITGLSE